MNTNPSSLEARHLDNGYSFLAKDIVLICDIITIHCHSARRDTSVISRNGGISLSSPLIIMIEVDIKLEHRVEDMVIGISTATSKVTSILFCLVSRY